MGRDIWVALFTGLATSLFGATVFFIALRLARPRISISNQIACADSPDGAFKCRIKIINRWWRLVDVRVEMDQITEVDSTRGEKLKRTRFITVDRPNRMEIPGWRRFFRGPDTDWAVRFGTNEDVRQILEPENRSIRFRIHAVAAFSGIPGVASHIYRGVDSVRMGTFEVGDTMKIAPVSLHNVGSDDEEVAEEVTPFPTEESSWAVNNAFKARSSSCETKSG